MIVNQTELLERDIERLAGESDSSVETERLDAIRREVARIAEVVERLGEMAAGDTYETVEYVGPARMVDLRGGARAPPQRDPRLEARASSSSTTTAASANRSRRSSRPRAAGVDTAGDGLEALAKRSSAAASTSCSPTS